eukprot:8607471-Pyramimonas_sp.AAC.1
MFTGNVSGPQSGTSPTEQCQSYGSHPSVGGVPDRALTDMRVSLLSRGRPLDQCQLTWASS